MHLPRVPFKRVFSQLCFIASALTHLPLDKIAAILQTIFSDAFSGRKVSYLNTCVAHFAYFMGMLVQISAPFNTLRSRQNDRHFADDICKCIFINEKVWIAIEILLKFVPNSSIYNKSSKVQVMAWCHVSPKPMVTQSTHGGRVTHICVSKLTDIGSDNGLSPGRRQAIIWTSAGILWRTKFSEILSEITPFSLKKMHLKM